MLKIENFEVMGWEHAIRGMRNPMNSWEKSDSKFNEDADFDPDDYIDQGMFLLGDNDYTLMKKLRDGGPVHAKYRRMITVYLDITAPLYWWKEFDTYKVGTVANSCSTMHKIHAKEFTIKVPDPLFEGSNEVTVPFNMLNLTVQSLNICRRKFLETNDKKYWWQMIQLLPSSYNQRRTVMLNYEVLANIYKSRKDHKLDEWHTLCHWIEELPYSELITGYEEE